MKLLALALAPALAIMIYIYYKDKYEREPIKLLLKNFGLGATASIFITMIIGAFGNVFLPVTDPESILQQFIKAFIKTDGGYLLLKDKSTVPVSVRKKVEVMDILSSIHRK